ncbi:MAG TPA: bacteriohopanetetrol glucosamine biosynthesis glycosyltransferase HpnI [Terriglobales bacterium]|nr:bacteriohopanetetrol glucosamine biosynthesis glycosyltransferase HpnI [Terriglobales bacterium]
MLAGLLLAVAALGILTSTVYLALVLVGALRFRRSAVVAPQFTEPLPGATVLKPLHGMEPGLRENLESFFRQDYPTFQIVFGVRHADDPALDVVRELREQYPRVPVQITVSGDPTWPNAKVQNLHSMMAAADHPLLVISDSDVRVSHSYLREVTRPLLDPKIGMVTCLYRGVNTGGFWSRLEAMGMSTELTSGVLVADLLEGTKFALGPTMATRREVLAAVGGFAALADYLADDYVLGNRVHAVGYHVVLSRHIIEHMVINRAMPSSLQHQVRWAKSTRRSRPKGHIGSGLTFSVPFGLLGLIGGFASGNLGLGAALLVAGVLNRIVQSLAVGWGVVRDRDSLTGAALYPLRDLLGFMCWAASFLGGRRTSWRGDNYVLQNDGRMVRESALAGAAGSQQSAA